jgi:hypothetical protein
MIGILALVSFVVTIEKYNFTYKVWGGGGGGGGCRFTEQFLSCTIINFLNLVICVSDEQ